jgi:hypothetical protein
MTKPKIVTVKIADLKVDLYVRQQLNQDHALELAALLEAGVVLPPIKITSEFVVVDGRHRIEAYKVLGLAEIECEVVDGLKDEVAIISMAYQANTGGSLPPTREDTEHTITELLARKVAKARIAEILALPPSLAKKYVQNVESKVTRSKIRKVLWRVANERVTLEQASAEESVDPEKVKEAMPGGRPGRKRHSLAADFQRNLTHLGKSAARKYAAILKDLLDKVGDGDVTVNQACEIFAHVERLQKANARATADWKARFDASCKNGRKSAA